MGPAESMTRARAARAEWNPNARRMMRRTRWLRPSRRALVRPRRIAARIPSRCSRMVRPALMNGWRRGRCTRAHQRSRSFRAGGFDALIPVQRRRQLVCDVELLYGMKGTVGSNAYIAYA